MSVAPSNVGQRGTTSHLQFRRPRGSSFINYSSPHRRSGSRRPNEKVAAGHHRSQRRLRHAAAPSTRPAKIVQVLGSGMGDGKGAASIWASRFRLGPLTEFSRLLELSRFSSFPNSFMPPCVKAVSCVDPARSKPVSVATALPKSLAPELASRRANNSNQVALIRSVDNGQSGTGEQGVQLGFRLGIEVERTGSRFARLQVDRQTRDGCGNVLVAVQRNHEIGGRRTAREDRPAMIDAHEPKRLAVLVEEHAPVEVLRCEEPVDLGRARPRRQRQAQNECRAQAKETRQTKTASRNACHRGALHWLEPCECEMDVPSLATAGVPDIRRGDRTEMILRT